MDHTYGRGASRKSPSVGGCVRESERESDIPASEVEHPDETMEGRTWIVGAGVGEGRGEYAGATGGHGGHL